MKRMLFALIVAAGLASAAYGAAATLDVKGATLQAGTASAVCDADGVNIDYTTDGSAPTSLVTSIAVTGIADDCVGATLKMIVSSWPDHPELGSTCSQLIVAGTGGDAAPVVADATGSSGCGGTLNPGLTIADLWALIITIRDE